MKTLALAAACWLSACSGTIDNNGGNGGSVGGTVGGNGGTSQPPGSTGAGTGVPDSADAAVTDAAPSTDAPAPPANVHGRCGWIGPGNENNGVGSFVANAAYFQVIHPDWWSIASDGVTLNPVGTPDDPQVMNAAAANGVQVWPLVAGVGTQAVLRSMMSTSTARSAHIQQLVQLVTSHNYAGLEMDYEGLWTAADRQPYTDFMQELATAMHAAGKQVSAAVPALTDTSVTNAWDYGALSQALDALHIMGYDYHYAGGDHPGPVAPLGWVDAACAQAQATGRASKFILGVPNYGVGGGGGYCSGTECAAQCSGAYDSVDTHMVNCPYGYWPAGLSPHCAVAGSVLYFDDVASTEQKVMSALAHGLGGVTYWNLGKEPPGLLDMFRRYF